MALQRNTTCEIALLASALTLAVLVLAAAGLLYAVRSRVHVTREQVWAIGVYHGQSLTSLAPAAGLHQPVFTADKVTDVKASFVADPFLFEHDSTWYLFFEVMNELTGQGDIGCATSHDTYAWAYRRIVLDEPFHLSFPHVVADSGTIYLIPESASAGAVRLYRAASFPDRWTHVADLLTGKYADSGLLKHGGVWWLFTCTAYTHDTLWLFCSDHIGGPYRPHPASPLITGDAHRSRLAGKITAVDGRLVRLAQDCDPTYGKQVLAFVIEQLDAHGYRERPLARTAILGPGRDGWNRHGMHQVDAHRSGTGMWIAVVDGYRKYLTVRTEY
jgi:hypothetical protein